MDESKKVEKGCDGLLSDVQGVKLRKSDISKRLEAGRTIHLSFKTKAQLLTLISGTVLEGRQTRSLIIGPNQKLKIVLIADPFAPHILMYVSIAESPLEELEDFEE